MDFTFGIITTGENDNYINIIIDSIYKNNIPNFEIIIVGNTSIKATEKITILYFNEDIKPGWITKKKNIIAKNAKYENLVLLHDYIKLDIDWYNGFLQFENNFDWCVTKILNNDGTRFRDYTLYPGMLDSSIIDDIYYYNNNSLLPYDFENSIKTNKYMYISGSYYVIKTKIALNYPLDENRTWGCSEDIELSQRLHNNGIIIKCNTSSIVSFLKYKAPVCWENEICRDKLQLFINNCNNSIN